MDAVADSQIGIPRLVRQLRLMDRLRIIDVTEIEPRVGSTVDRVTLDAFKAAVYDHAVSSRSAASSANRSSRLLA